MRRSSRVIQDISRRVVVAKWTTWLLVIGLLLFVGNILIFYPGHMSNDTIQQLSQAVGSKPFNDWHPPIMALLWSVFISVTGYIASMLVFQLSLLWLSLYLLARYLSQISRKRWVSLLPYALGLSPFVLNISGTIWKDVQMALAFLLASVLLLVYAKKLRANKLVILAIALLVIYGTLMRYNAVLAAIPIVYYCINLYMAKSHKKIKVGLAIVGGFAILLINLLVGAVFPVEKTHPTSAVMLDDIVSVRQDRSFDEVSQPLRQHLYDVRSRCMKKSVPINSFWVCAEDKDRAIVSQTYYKELSAFWLKTILQHPLSYIQYRAYTFTLLLFVPDERAYVYAGGIVPNSLGVKPRGVYTTKALGVYVNDFGYKHFAFLYQAWFWVLAAIALAFMSRRARVHGAYIRMLAWSALLYIFAYIPMVVAADYRYIYWPVIAVSVGAILLFVERGKKWARR